LRGFGGARFVCVGVLVVDEDDVVAGAVEEAGGDARSEAAGAMDPELEVWELVDSDDAGGADEEKARGGGFARLWPAA
jgi:hypothetical protein